MLFKIKQKIETLLEIKIKFGNRIKRERAMRHSIQKLVPKNYDSGKAVGG